jgi:hypothetical protein
MEVVHFDDTELIKEIRLRGLLASVHPSTTSAIENNHAEIRFLLAPDKTTLRELTERNSVQAWTREVPMDNQMRLRTVWGHDGNALQFKEKLVGIQRQVMERKSMGLTFKRNEIFLLRAEDDPEFKPTDFSQRPLPTRLQVFLLAIQRTAETSQLLKSCSEARNLQSRATDL